MDIKKLFSFISASPTAPHAVAEVAKTLEGAGYTRLVEGQTWNLVPGGTYFVQRGLSALAAFRLPKGVPTGVMMVAAHGDSPAFSLTPSAMSVSGKYSRMTVEKYGGMLCATWLDRPLSLAGVVTLRGKDGGVQCRLVDMKEPVALIPSVAIHMNRNANDGASYNPAVDMQPLWGMKSAASPMEAVAKELGVDPADILSHRLWLYNPEAPTLWGADKAFFSAPRIDDLSCVACGVEALLNAPDSTAIPMMLVFDNEEVGSSTFAGAGSDFLPRAIESLCVALSLSGVEKERILSQSILLSADNAHAIHPNHPEYADANNAPVLGGGVVLKYNANCRYGTDAISGGIFAGICREAGVEVQNYCNRADIPGGSTLGCISVSQLSVPVADIGLAQLAMHSSYESASVADIDAMERALTAFFGSSLTKEGDGTYRIQK